MTFGISNVTNVQLENLTYIANSTTLPEFYIKVNWVIYGGIFWFIMLWVIFFILFIAAQRVRDQPLNNAMYAGASVTILSFVIRAITVVNKGVVQGMLTDHQMWAFPLLTIILATIIWSIKD